MFAEYYALVYIYETCSVGRDVQLQTDRQRDRPSARERADADCDAIICCMFLTVYCMSASPQQPTSNLTFEGGKAEGGQNIVAKFMVRLCFRLQWCMLLCSTRVIGEWGDASTGSSSLCGPVRHATAGAARTAASMHHVVQSIPLCCVYRIPLYL